MEPSEEPERRKDSSVDQQIQIPTLPAQQQLTLSATISPTISLLQQTPSVVSESRVDRFSTSLRHLSSNIDADLPERVSPTESLSFRPSTPSSSEKASVSDRPLSFCVFMVSHYRLAFCVTLSVHLLFAGATTLLYFLGYDIFPLYFDQIPLEILDDPMFKRARAYDTLIHQHTSDTFGIPPQALTSDSVHYYELVLYVEAENVLTTDNLKAMHRLENDFIVTLGKDEKCRAAQPRTNTSRLICVKGLSVLRHFETLQHANFSLIVEVMYRAYHGKDGPTVKSLLASTARISKTEATSSITRIVIPLELKENTAYLVDKILPKLRELVKDGYKGLKVRFSNTQIFMHEVSEQVKMSTKLTLGSFLLIYMLTLLHTGSLFITTMATTSILTSFLGANLIYRVVLDYKFFGILHVLCLFIMLGIGTDLMLVFNGTWQTPQLQMYPRLEDRLSSCYRQTFCPIVTSSLTACAAFLLTLHSPLLPINSFGLFTTIFMGVTFVSILAFFPTVIVLYHVTLSSCQWCPCLFEMPDTTASSSSSLTLKTTLPFDCFLVRFFKGPFHKAIKHSLLKWCFILVSAFVFAPFGLAAFNLQPSTAEMQIFKQGHFFYESSRLARDGFLRELTQNERQILILFGLKTIDQSACHKTQFFCPGEVVFDDAFDMNPKPSQRALLDLCSSMYNLRGYSKLRIIRKSLTGKSKMTCFISMLDEFIRAIGQDSYVFSSPLDLSLPFSEIKFEGFFNQSHDLFGTVLTDNHKFYRYFETLMNYFMDIQMPHIGAYIRPKLYIDDDDPHDTSNTTTGIKYGKKLLFAALSVSIHHYPFTEEISSGLAMMETWENFISELMSRMPRSVQGFQVAKGDFWHRLITQQVLLDSATHGLMVSMALVTVLLLLTTANLILALMVTLTVGMVGVTICGSIALFEWQISLIESIILTLMVGLAASHVVRLSLAYHYSEQEDRLSKVQDMLQSGGASVLSGTLSIVGAAIFLLGSQIHFFFGFGILICFIAGFSSLFSLCLFTPLLAIIGPEQDVGFFLSLPRWVWHLFIGRRSEDEDCGTCHGKGFVISKTGTPDSAT